MRFDVVRELAGRRQVGAGCRSPAKLEGLPGRPLLAERGQTRPIVPSIILAEIQRLVVRRSGMIELSGRAFVTGVAVRHGTS